jgi:hypothetical protein
MTSDSFEQNLNSIFCRKNENIGFYVGDRQQFVLFVSGLVACLFLRRDEDDKPDRGF